MAEGVRSRKALGPARPSLRRRLADVLGKDWTVAWAFMAPTSILMGGIIAYPSFRAFYISFTNTTSLQIGPWVGLTNYINLWKDIFFRGLGVGYSAIHPFGGVSQAAGGRPRRDPPEPSGE